MSNKRIVISQEILDKYQDDFGKLVNDDLEILVHPSIDLFDKLVRLVLDHDNRIVDVVDSNYDLKIVTKLVNNQHINIGPELFISHELWQFMTNILYDINKSRNLEI